MIDLGKVRPAWQDWKRKAKMDCISLTSFAHPLTNIVQLRAGLVGEENLLEPFFSSKSQERAWYRATARYNPFRQKEVTMGFTVTKPVGTRDAEFEAYVRLLRQQGKDLANLPRVPDPENPTRRWVYVWNTQEEAQQFADELKEQTGDNGWHVKPTAAPPSKGPFGPVLIQLARRSDGLVFALHPLSRAMIQDAFPDLLPGATNAFVNMQTWNDFLRSHGELTNLAAEIVPSLTGLNREQLTELGYAVIDADNDRTWVYVPPAGTAQNQT
jgi:hypothetical protein